MHFSKYSLERFCDDTEFVLYVAHAMQVDLPSILLLVTASTLPLPHSMIAFVPRDLPGKTLFDPYQVLRLVPSCWTFNENPNN